MNARAKRHMEKALIELNARESEPLNALSALALARTEFYDNCTRTINIAFGGEHHCKKVTREERKTTVLFYGTMATWDRNELTNLVLAAHKYCIRIEIGNGGPRTLKVTLTPRKPFDEVRTRPIASGHPTIEHVVSKWEENKTSGLAVSEEWQSPVEEGATP